MHGLDPARFGRLEQLHALCHRAAFMATTFNGTGLPGVVRMQQWSAFGQFAGPPLVAWVASSAGGWHWTWVVTGLCAAAGLLLARQLGRQLERQQERLPHAEAA